MGGGGVGINDKQGEKNRMQKKMADLSPSIPIIALNINDLKTPT